MRDFTLVACAVEDVPNEAGRSKALGRHWEGCRIGFDLAALDLKVAAVIDGKVVYREEMVWEPAIQLDPEYQFEWMVSALRQAASQAG